MFFNKIFTIYLKKIVIFKQLSYIYKKFSIYRLRLYFKLNLERLLNYYILVIKINIK